MLHIIYKICVNQLYVISKTLVNSRLLVIKFWGNQKLHVDFPLHVGVGALVPAWFMGQLYLTLTHLVYATSAELKTFK